MDLFLTEEDAGMGRVLRSEGGWAEYSLAKYAWALFLWKDDHLYLSRFGLLVRGVTSNGHHCQGGR